jgi:hypothetical protein
MYAMDEKAARNKFLTSVRLWVAVMVSIFAAENVVGRVACTIHQSNTTVVQTISVRS